ncbi:unknown [Clostridium sp. CAG:632]|nr:unknown [Clostridium sp. CAG:632]
MKLNADYRRKDLSVQMCCCCCQMANGTRAMISYELS